MGIDLDNINSGLGLEGSSELLVLGGLLRARKGQQMRVVVDIVQLIELLVELKHDPEDGGGFGKLVKEVKSFGIKFKSLGHHLLSEDHHDQVLESTANDHVSDGSADKLLEEPLLRLFVGEEAL